MNQRQRFIEEWLHDEWSFSALCEAFCISRKTGYKWLERFKIGGLPTWLTNVEPVKRIQMPRRRR